MWVIAPVVSRSLRASSPAGNGPSTITSCRHDRSDGPMPASRAITSLTASAADNHGGNRPSDPLHDVVIFLCHHSQCNPH